jgi:quinoprotein dehydrogenase-associated probable ABC transporter substrate-binding protein
MRRSTDAPAQRRRLLAGVIALAAIGFAAAAGAADDGGRTPLRVCSDPDNMPFSNARGDGFENRLAALVAGELGKSVTYAWAPQDGDFVHDTLNAGQCDVIVGVPSGFGSVATTRPYYWSSYVLVSRADRHLDISSVKDHRLRTMRIGVASVAGNRLYSPPAQALADLGLLDGIVGFPIDESRGGVDSQRRIVDAVANGDIDLAALWGPTAGYFVQRSAVPLKMTMIGDTDEFSARKSHFALLGMQFEIAMAVRKGDDALRRQLDQVIARKQPEITAVLKRFGVPLIEPSELVAAAGRSE